MQGYTEGICRVILREYAELYRGNMQSYTEGICRVILREYAGLY